MTGAAEINLLNFSIVYLLLIIVIVIMKLSKVKKTRLLLWASFRMTVQLVLAGLVLTYIFKNPHFLFTIGYFVTMTVFAVIRVLYLNKNLNKKFKLIVALSITFSGLVMVIFFIAVITRQSLFNAQYVIPISGMIIGNSMTGVSLSLKAFNDNLESQKNKIETLINIGSTPKKILMPFVNKSLETALLPTMNSMLGMGIISLPGMMTGQILSGTLPTTAILYQIAIMISICTVVCVSVFCSLYFGHKTLYNKKKQFVYLW